VRLNKADRQTIINAIVDDIPTIDYKEQMRVKIQKAAYEALPQEVKVINDNHGLKLYLAESYTYIGRGFGSVYHTNTQFKLEGALCEEIYAMCDKADEQAKQLRSLQAQLLGVFDTVRTYEQAKVKLPEFEKYISMVEKSNGHVAPTENLPVANILSKMMELGWVQDAN
jgi:hypothetical protein